MVRLCILLLVSFALAACAGIRIEHVSLPEDLVEEARVVNFESARSWADSLTPDFLEKLEERQQQIRNSGIVKGRLETLALSGGGADGAFGAGYLNGWTDRGNRPEFEVVTGVSTGALIAPIAFLGPDYDDDLERFYTGVETKDILRKDPIGGLLGGGAAVTNSEPLANLIAQVATPEVVAKVAREHERGRRLFVITTNIEAQRPVIWDMGQIARVGTPEAVDLFRALMLASASIPGAFPPVRIDVVAAGKSYSELHVDGGTTTNVFLAPLNVSVPKERLKRGVRMYVLRNGKFLPEYKPVKARTLSIAGRAISTMIKYNTNSDVSRLKILARRMGAELRFVSIPNEFDEKSKEAFDPVYMKKLYDFGYSAGRRGDLVTTDPKVF
jgi:hypothetical protein